MNPIYMTYTGNSIYPLQHLSQIQKCPPFNSKHTHHITKRCYASRLKADTCFPILSRLSQSWQFKAKVLSCS